MDLSSPKPDQWCETCEAITDHLWCGPVLNGSSERSATVLMMFHEMIRDAAV